jgi:uncharacterized membrane protein YphA (DoxX/SURF4 family)
MLLRKAQLSFLAVLALIALRVVVGWHFFMEGTDKVQKGGFSSTGFLSAAKGPLAKTFQAMVPDFDGSVRLDEEKMKKAYETFASEAGALFKFTEDQTAETATIISATRKQLSAVYKEWKPQIDEYKNGVPRVALLENDPMRSNVSSMRKQRDEIETKWKGLVKQALYDIDKINDEFETAINALATDAQIEGGKLAANFKLPGSPAIDVKLIDKIIPIFDMSVGILLILGLLTPVAGLAAGIFLASVVLTQFPGSYGSQPTYYQAIEMVSCFFLAFSDAGRYAGLDFIPWSFWNRNSQMIVHPAYSGK